jgi:hypothetical protein
MGRKGPAAIERRRGDGRRRSLNGHHGEAQDEGQQDVADDPRHLPERVLHLTAPRRCPSFAIRCRKANVSRSSGQAQVFSACADGIAVAVPDGRFRIDSVAKLLTKRFFYVRL